MYKLEITDSTGKMRGSLGYSSEREAKKALKVIAEFIKNSSDPRFPGSSLSFMGTKITSWKWTIKIVKQ